MWRHAGLLLTIFSISLFGTASAEDAPVTLSSLLGEMTRLERLATLPSPAYTTHQFSSYDRRSKSPDALTDDNWFANGDRGHHLRTEKRNGAKEYVMVDTQGPGAIVRMWSANPDDAGIVRIYLDGAADPVIEMPLSAYLGGASDLGPEPIGGMRSRGWNSYLPIPFAKSCKVTASEPDFYYLVNYRVYAEGTVVTSFDASQGERYVREIATVATTLSDPVSVGLATGRIVKNKATKVGLPAGGKIDLARVAGPAAIYGLLFNVDAPDLEGALRSTVLQITFDGRERPQVEAPLGDFFGTAPGANPYRSLPCGVLDDGTLYSHWVMPFQETAVVSVVNNGAGTITLEGRVHHADRPWTDDSLYFHAQWRAEFGIKTRPRQDWNFVSIEGAGRFVGDMLHVANPVPAWWGEGDEKIYVDGEDFPSHFGTGSEDYYGYAWCDNQPFTHAYHNQPRCDGPGNYGHTCVSRFHIMDDIPFTKSLSFNMEVWHWSDTTVDQAATSFWYATADSAHNRSRPRKADLYIPDVPALPEPKRVEGALEAEDMTVAAVTGGNVQIQEGWTFPWSGGQQQWWMDGKPGDRLDLTFEVDAAGRYKVLGVFTKAIDYGIHTIRINGATAVEALDCVNDGVIATPELSLGIHDLKQGANHLEIEIAGSNPKARPARHMAGIDYLRLESATP